MYLPERQLDEVTVWRKCTKELTKIWSAIVLYSMLSCFFIGGYDVV